MSGRAKNKFTQTGASTECYEVGYDRPPVHSRFKKGQSGTPKGRPKARSH